MVHQIPQKTQRNPNIQGIVTAMPSLVRKSVTGAEDPLSSRFAL